MFSRDGSESRNGVANIYSKNDRTSKLIMNTVFLQKNYIINIHIQWELQSILIRISPISNYSLKSFRIKYYSQLASFLKWPALSISKQIPELDIYEDYLKITVHVRTYWCCLKKQKKIYKKTYYIAAYN